MEVRGQSYNDESLGQTEYQLRNNSWLGKKKNHYQVIVAAS